jgi:hypothetical protein
MTKYAIRLSSRHTGDSIVLGSMYNTKEEAQKYADMEVCGRCNIVKIFPVDDDERWINKNIGFMPPNYWRKAE